MKKYYEGEALKNTELFSGSALKLKENLKQCDISFAKSIANKIFAFGVYVVDVELTNMALGLGADINTFVNDRPALIQLSFNNIYKPQIGEIAKILIAEGIDLYSKYEFQACGLSAVVNIIDFLKSQMPALYQEIKDTIIELGTHPVAEAAAAAHVPPGGAPFDPIACAGDIESPEGPDLS